MVHSGLLLVKICAVLSFSSGKFVRDVETLEDVCICCGDLSRTSRNLLLVGLGDLSQERENGEEILQRLNLNWNVVDETICS